MLAPALPLHPNAGLAFGAGITIAALFIALPKAITWSPWVPLLRDRQVPWRAVVGAAALLALLGLWHPLASAVGIAVGVLLIVVATDLTPLDPSLPDQEGRFAQGLHPPKPED